jgi:hypothetical protein
VPDRLALDTTAAPTARARISLRRRPGSRLSRNFADDHEMLRHGMVMYDALYACRKGVHNWNPAAYR